MAHDVSPSIPQARRRCHGLSAGGEPCGLTAREHARLAELLLKATAERRAIEPLSRRFPELTPEDARRIRDTTMARRLRTGQRRIGASTSVDAGADAHLIPFGWMTSGMVLRSAALPLERLIRPRAAAKLAVRLGHRLHRRHLGHEELRAAISDVVPTIEVVDSRYGNSVMNATDLLADNCGATWLRVGAPVALPHDVSATRVRVEVRDPAWASGDPRQLVATGGFFDGVLALARSVVAERGELGPGALLLASTPVAPVELHPGTTIRADWGSLGAVEVRSTATPSEEEVLA